MHYSLHISGIAKPLSYSPVKMLLRFWWCWIVDFGMLWYWYVVFCKQHGWSKLIAVSHSVYIFQWYGFSQHSRWEVLYQWDFPQDSCIMFGLLLGPYLSHIHLGRFCLYSPKTYPCVQSLLSNAAYHVWFISQSVHCLKIMHVHPLCRVL